MSDERYIPCKIGTIPASVRVYGRCKIALDKWIRVKLRGEYEWIFVYVDKINDDGYFFASR